MEYSVYELSIKCRSKNEFYNVLARDVNIYLPPLHEATQKYLRAIMNGDKKYLKCNRVSVIKVPHYTGLTVKDILSFAESKTNIHEFLPDFEYDKLPNREWFSNVVNTLIHDDFVEYISTKVNERKKAIYESQNISTQIRPEFIEIFKNSQSISFKKGKSHFLTCPPKKTKYQIEAEEHKGKKEKAEFKNIELEKKIRELVAKIESLEQKQLEAEDNLDRLSELYELGVIDKDGRLIKNDMS